MSCDRTNIYPKTSSMWFLLGVQFNFKIVTLWFLKKWFFVSLLAGILNFFLKPEMRLGLP